MNNNDIMFEKKTNVEFSEEEKKIIEIETELSTENISVDTYLDYFFKINSAVSTGKVNNPLRLYLTLRNASVIVTATESENKVDVYKNVINTVDLLISNYAKEYITGNNELVNYNISLNEEINNKGYLTFNEFKKAYYLFELYVLAGVKKDGFIELIGLLNKLHVKTDNVYEIIDLSNMKTRLLTYNDYFKKEKKIKTLG